MIIKNKLKGFTIIELLVVLAIFALIISVSLANYNAGSRQSKLKMSLQNFSANIRLTQSYAMGSKDFADPNSGKNIVPRGGWGIYLNKARPSKYRIVVDLDDDHYFDETSDGSYKLLTFDDNIVIDEILENNSSVDQAAIFFQPPDPQTFINGSNSNNITIYLKDKVANTSSAVTVNFFGLIENE